MSRFELIKDTSGNAELAEAYKGAMAMGWQGVEEGLPTNFIQSMGTRPDLIKGLLDIVGSLFAGGELPPTVKAMIMMTIAERTNCRYCAVGHKKVLESMGVPNEVIQSCAKDPDLADLPPSQREIIRFALKSAKYPQDITDEDFQTLRDQGMGDGEIIEVVMCAAVAVVLDIYADVSRVVVDGEEA